MRKEESTQPICAWMSLFHPLLHEIDTFVQIFEDGNPAAIQTQDSDNCIRTDDILGSGTYATSQESLSTLLPAGTYDVVFNGYNHQGDYAVDWTCAGKCSVGCGTQQYACVSSDCMSIAGDRLTFEGAGTVSAFLSALCPTEYAACAADSACSSAVASADTEAGVVVSDTASAVAQNLKACIASDFA